MIALESTTRSLEVDLDAAVAANQLVYNVTYVDIEQATQGMSSSTGADGTSNSTTAVTMVSAPSSGYTRVVKFLSVYNNDTSSAVVTVQKNSNGTLRILWKGTLQPGHALQFAEDGFRVIDNYGQILTSAGGATSVSVQQFSGDDSTTAFVVSGTPGSKNATWVFIDGVYQDKSQYSLSGSTFTFTTAPPTGTSNIEIQYATNIVLSTPSDATVTSAKIAAPDSFTDIGTPADDDVVLAYDTSASAWKVSDVSAVRSFRKNAIINGAFDIWQRGEVQASYSWASAANGQTTADRWNYGKIGAMVHTISRSTDVPTVAEAGRLFNYSLLVDCTTVDSSIAAGDVCLIDQRVEGYNFLPLAQRAFTLSFWVKATKTGTYCVAFRNSVNDRSYVAEYTVSATNTWECKTITVTASPSAGTWDYTTGVGIAVAFTLACGSTFQTTANAWQTGNYLATSNQVNACDDTANDFRITGVQLEAGSAATEFEYRHIQDEQALCERYYEIFGGAGQTYFADWNADGASSVTGCWAWNFKTTKRAIPTISTAGGFTTANTTGSLGYQPTTRGTTTYLNAAAAGRAYIYNNSGSFLTASAEL